MWAGRTCISTQAFLCPPSKQINTPSMACSGLKLNAAAAGEMLRPSHKRYYKGDLQEPGSGNNSICLSVGRTGDSQVPPPLVLPSADFLEPGLLGARDIETRRTLVFSRSSCVGAANTCSVTIRRVEQPRGYSSLGGSPSPGGKAWLSLEG